MHGTLAFYGALGTAAGSIQILKRLQILFNILWRQRDLIFLQVVF
jgi:hypothetical protein